MHACSKEMESKEKNKHNKHCCGCHRDFECLNVGFISISRLVEAEQVSELKVIQACVVPSVFAT